MAHLVLSPSRKKTRAYPPTPSDRFGFSLLELLIVLALLGMLLAIAVPGYQEPMSRSMAAEGKRALFEAAAGLEWCLIEGSDLETCATQLPEAGQYYRIELQTSPSGFRLRALANHPTAQRGPCPELGLERGGLPEPIDC